MKRMSLESAHEEASKLQEKIAAHEAKDYSEAEKLVENSENPEINTAELLTLIDDIKWEFGYDFTFDGIDFSLFITDIDELKEAEAEGTLDRHGEPAEYHRHPDNFGIYIHDTIPESDRKRVLFHEILECVLREQNFSEKEAHGIVLKEEEKIFGQRKE